MSTLSHPSHGRYIEVEEEGRGLLNPNPTVIGAPPSRHRHYTSWRDQNLGGRVLQVAMVVVLVVFNVAWIYALGKWIGLW